MIDFRHRLGYIVWRGLPACCLLAALILAQATGGLSLLQEIFPALAVSVIFYWSISAPERLPNWLLFSLGMARDALAGTPLGVSAFLWLGLRKTVQLTRAEVQEAGFGVVWGYFAVLLLGYVLLEWALMMLLAAPLHFPAALGVQYAVTLCLYPAMHRLMGALNRRLYRRIWFMARHP